MITSAGVLDMEILNLLICVGTWPVHDPPITRRQWRALGLS